MNTTNPIQAFSAQLNQLESEQQVTDFLNALLTPKELEEIANRMEIIRLLRLEVSQREIAQQLGVGIATVTRGARVLKTGGLEELLPQLDKKS